MHKRINLKRSVIAWLSVLSICCAAVFPVFAQSDDPEGDKQVKELIEKIQAEKKNQHPKIQPILTELEDAYKKGGEEEAKKSAKARGISIKENKKIRVYIIIDYELPLSDQIDEAELVRHGVEIIYRAFGLIEADIPIDRMREIVDNVKGVVQMRLPQKMVPQSLTSEGVSITGAARCRSSGVTRTGVKAAMIAVG